MPETYTGIRPDAGRSVPKTFHAFVFEAMDATSSRSGAGCRICLARQCRAETTKLAYFLIARDYRDSTFAARMRVAEAFESVGSRPLQSVVL